MVFANSSPGDCVHLGKRHNSSTTSMKARTKDRLRRFAKLKNHTARILAFRPSCLPRRNRMKAGHAILSRRSLGVDGSLVRRRISVFLFAYMNDELQSRTEPRVSPEFLSNLWDEHMRHEFATHNTEDTLATMVDDAYVNHIPVLTGGVGKDALREFYS